MKNEEEETKKKRKSLWHFNCDCTKRKSPIFMLVFLCRIITISNAINKQSKIKLFFN